MQAADEIRSETQSEASASKAQLILYPQDVAERQKTAQDAAKAIVDAVRTAKPPSPPNKEQPLAYLTAAATGAQATLLASYGVSDVTQYTPPDPLTAADVVTYTAVLATQAVVNAVTRAVAQPKPTVADIKAAAQNAQDYAISLAALEVNNNKITGAGLTLEAADEGSWANGLLAVVDRNGITRESAAPFQSYNLRPDDLFNLTVQYTTAGGQVMVERFTNLAVRGGGPNQLDHVLKNESMLVRVQPGLDDEGEVTTGLPKLPPPDKSAGVATGAADGGPLGVKTYLGDEYLKTGLYALEKVDLFNLLYIPRSRQHLGHRPPGLLGEQPRTARSGALC